MADSQFVGQLVELLTQVTAPNSAVIKAASTKLQNEFYTQPQSVPALVSIMQTNASPQLRQLAAIEARKRVMTHWEELDENLRSQMRSSLLQSTLQEQTSIVRHASSRVISEIAKIDLSEGKWPDLPAFLQNASVSQSPSDREVGVYILYTLLDVIDGTFANKLQELFGIFSRTINDGENQAVRVNTVLALGKVAEILEGEGNSPNVQAFRQLLPSMVEVLKAVIGSDDEKSASLIFEVFQTLLIVDSSLIAKHLGDLVQFFLSLAASKDADSQYRCLALQFLMSAVRFKKLKVQSLKLGPVLTTSALEIATEDIEDDDDDDDTPSRLALRLIDVLSSTLPPSQVMNILISQIPTLTSSQEAAHRRAGLLALGVAVEGSPDFVSTQIQMILPIVVNGMRDPLLPVRVAALQALVQLADELQEVVAREHETLLPLVFGLMDTTDPKVGKAACTALDAILEPMDKDVITGYLPTLMERLLGLLNQPSNDVEVKGTIISAIGSAAHASGSAFLPYFEASVRSFEPYLGLKEGEKELDVKGMTFDSLGAVATAVGKDSFNQFANAVVHSAYEALSSGHNRLRESSFILFGVLAKVYGSEFSPFLPQIMPEILKCLNQEEGQFLFGDGQEDVDVNDIAEEDMWHNVTVNSGMAMEKEVAAEAIGDLIASTKEAFLPYLDETTTVLLDLGKHFYEGIRKAAISSLWRALAVLYQISNPPKWQPGATLKVPLSDTVTEYAKLVRGLTLDAFDEEDDRSTATVICDNLAETIRLCGPGIIGPDIEPIATQILAIIKKQHRSQVLEDEFDEEEEDMEDIAEYDVLLIDSAMDVVVSLAFAYKEDFMPYFQTFCPLILKFCSSSSPGERKSGVGAIAEIANGLKETVTPYTAQLLKVLIHRLSDESIEVRSNAAYGFGMLCEASTASQEITAEYNKVLGKLQQMLETDRANDRCVANICGCVARMISSNMASVPVADVLPALVYTLPLKDGCEENDPIFRLIVHLYKINDSTVQGLTERIISVLDQIFSKDSADSRQFEFDETKAQVVELLKYINQSSPGAIQSQALLYAIQ
ncbi:armadillo-type protein [Dipodascopsis tothii]|uniref:armadillo-type protein n=1 Tax=Dipodascopsis tothii TaxID=44089 RepID=UPI0034CD41C2